MFSRKISKIVKRGVDLLIDKNKITSSIPKAAVRSDCKGITVFISGSKLKQVLYVNSTFCLGIECGN